MGCSSSGRTGLGSDPNCQRRSNCQVLSGQVGHGLVRPATSSARTCHQYWSLSSVVAGDQWFPYVVAEAAIVLKFRSVLTRTSYFCAPSTASQPSTTSLTRVSGLFAGLGSVGCAIGSTVYDRTPDHSVARPALRSARTRQYQVFGACGEVNR